MTRSNPIASELPLLIEPDHWGVVLTRHLISTLLGIVLALVLCMWLIADSIDIERSVRANVIGVVPCTPSANTKKIALNDQDECIQFSLATATPEQFVALPVRIEVEETRTYRRFALNSQVQSMMPTLGDKVLFEAELDSAKISHPGHKIKQVLLITGTQSGWAVFCQWLKQTVASF